MCRIHRSVEVCLVSVTLCLILCAPSNYCLSRNSVHGTGTGHSPDQLADTFTKELFVKYSNNTQFLQFTDLVELFKSLGFEINDSYHDGNVVHDHSTVDIEPHHGN